MNRSWPERRHHRERVMEKVSITPDTRPFVVGMERVRLALDRFVYAFGLALGYPTREDRAREQRIDRHLARCAQRREQRRRQRR